MREWERLGAMHNQMAAVTMNLAYVAGKRGRSEEAETLFLRAIAIREAHFGANHIDIPPAYRVHAEFLQGLGRKGEAAAVLQIIQRRGLTA